METKQPVCSKAAGLLLSLRSRLSTLLQFLLHLFHDLVRIRLDRRLEPGDNLAVATDQELLEVPADLAAESGISLFRREELVQRGGILSVDVNLRKHVEGHAVV